MSNEILVNVTPRETRVAVLENGLLQEVLIERAKKRSMIGNIYKGKVSRVLPGMQAAFVDIGLERTAFLHASDIRVRSNEDKDGSSDKFTTAPIASLLSDHQEIVVQVIKDPLGSKGPRLTTHISIPSRYVVFMPEMDNVGISQKIDDEEERQRLRDIVTSHDHSGIPGGYIIRTVAEGAAAEDLIKDIEFLQRLWTSIQQQIKKASIGQALYKDLPPGMKILRDLPNLHIDKIRIDSRENYKKILNFAQDFIPELASRIEHYPGERPIFDLYSVEDEIQRALETKVQLKSGGHLFIDQTESMTTIDINTGAFVGHRNLEETAYKTNLEAAQAIVRQLRLRNLGGIIIIDFIDMLEEDHKSQVLQILEKSLKMDRTKSHISNVSPLGLVEMTRKRTTESLERILCEPCPMCSGGGTVKTKDTVCYEIFREILREARQFEAKQILVLASQEVVDMLLDEESTTVAELEEFIGKSVKLQVESSYTQEQFDVVLT